MVPAKLSQNVCTERPAGPTNSHIHIFVVSECPEVHHAVRRFSRVLSGARWSEVTFSSSADIVW